MPRAIALSPHLDDAAFSCGGTLAGLVRAGWEVTLCTVFTRSVSDPTGFALACQLDKGLPPDIDYMALRRREDARACTRLGCRPEWLPFAEAPHRGYPDAKALFGPVLPEDDVVLPLCDSLAGVLRAGADLILAPQAIGGHVDHVQLVTALLRMRPPHTPVLWWTDFPYSARSHMHPAQPFAAIMTPLQSGTLPTAPEARLDACAAYTSQIGFQFGGFDGLVRSLSEAGSLEVLRLQGSLPAPLSTAWQAGI